jgi:signal peptidase II
MSLIKKNFFSYLLIFILFSIDRITKYLIVIYSNPSGELIIPITSFLKLNLIWNSGIAFGLLSFQQDLYYNLLTVIIIIITLILSYFMIKSNYVEKAAFCLIIGGSLGNIFDRIYYSSVVDFIDFHINNFHWFIFNVADIFITTGVIILIVLEILKKNDKKY